VTSAFLPASTRMIALWNGGDFVFAVRFTLFIAILAANAKSFHID